MALLRDERRVFNQPVAPQIRAHPARRRAGERVFGSVRRDAEVPGKRVPTRGDAAQAKQMRAEKRPLSAKFSVRGNVELNPPEDVLIPNGDHQLRGAGADRLDGDTGQGIFRAQAENGHHSFRIEGLQEFGYFLRHDDALDLTVFRDDFDGNDARFQFEGDGLVIGDQFQTAGFDQRVYGRDRRMSGEGDFFGGGEVPRAEVRPV